MATKYDSAANGGDESVRLLAARLAQSSLTQETATLHVLPSTTSPGEPPQTGGGAREPFQRVPGRAAGTTSSGGGGTPPRAQ